MSFRDNFTSSGRPGKFEWYDGLGVARWHLDSVTVPGVGRKYKTPNGDWYDSVTTIIGRQPDPNNPNWKEEWETKVGADEAARISGEALRRGTSVHHMMESYVKGDPAWLMNTMPVNRINFRRVTPVLDRHLELVYGCELPLWSDRLKTAGTTDLVGKWDGSLSIIDLKGARYPKKESYIWGYKVQAACYGMMFEARYRINIEKLVVLVMVEHDEPQVFEDRLDSWRDEVRKVFC